MLKIESLNQYYGGSHILRDVNLSAEAGKLTVLLGRNGVGKTTLLRCLMGVVAARRGTIAWQGRTLDALAPHARGGRPRLRAAGPQGRRAAGPQGRRAAISFRA